MEFKTIDELLENQQERKQNLMNMIGVPSEKYKKRINLEKQFIGERRQFEQQQLKTEKFRKWILMDIYDNTRGFNLKNELYFDKTGNYLLYEDHVYVISNGVIKMGCSPEFIDTLEFV